MQTLIAKVEAGSRRKQLPDFRPGDIVRVHQRIREGGKERIQVFEGLVIAKKHGVSLSGTFTVRRIASGVGVERVFSLHSPAIAKIERVRSAEVRRAKLYYLRGRIGKKARLKTVDAYASWEDLEEEPAEEPSAAEEPAAQVTAGEEPLDEEVAPEEKSAEDGPGEAEASPEGESAEKASAPISEVE